MEENENNLYSTSLPPGWVQANYVTATHYLVGHLMKDGSQFRDRWDRFSQLWDDATGLEMHIKQEQIRRMFQGFGDEKTRQAVKRALRDNKSRAAGAIDLLRLDKILIAENLQPLISLDPEGFVAKTPGSKKEEAYRKNGVPSSITNDYEALVYIKDNGPPITQTDSTLSRGNRDPRIKAKRVFAEWVRWLEYKALKNLVKAMNEEVGPELTEKTVENLLNNFQ